MRFDILWVGRTKEGYLAEGINRYISMLSPYAKVKIREVREVRGKPPETIMDIEGRRILDAVDRFTLLSEEGREMDSRGFAEYLDKNPSMTFVIGGPYGVSEQVKKRASEMISLSKMTFTHEMARLIFLEQLYRGITILKGKRYHY